MDNYGAFEVQREVIKREISTAVCIASGYRGGGGMGQAGAWPGRGVCLSPLQILGVE